MNRITKTLVGLTFASFAILACDKPAETKPDDPAAKNGTTTTQGTVAPNGTTASTAVTPPTPLPIVIADSDLSTPADFEETAEKAISAKNYKAELQTIETDVARN